MSVEREESLTPAQRCAAHALKAVLDLMNKKKEEEGDREFLALYRSYVERMGPAIIMNGLGQALASERAAAGAKKEKEEKVHWRLYCNLSNWLTRTGGVYAGAPDVLEAIISGSQDKYLRAQVEALRWIEWHKKFCQAYLPRAEKQD